MSFATGERVYAQEFLDSKPFIPYRVTDASILVVFLKDARRFGLEIESPNAPIETLRDGFLLLRCRDLSVDLLLCNMPGEGQPSGPKLSEAKSQVVLLSATIYKSDHVHAGEFDSLSQALAAVMLLFRKAGFLQRPPVSSESPFGVPITAATDVGGGAAGVEPIPQPLARADAAIRLDDLRRVYQARCRDVDGAKLVSEKFPSGKILLAAFALAVITAFTYRGVYNAGSAVLVIAFVVCYFREQALRRGIQVARDLAHSAYTALQAHAPDDTGPPIA